MIDRLTKLPAIASILGIALLLVLPFVLTRSLLFFMTTMLILFVFAVSYDFLYGYAGLLSLMHASFYGLGSAVFYHLITATQSTLLGIIVAMLAAFVFGLVIGTIATRVVGVGFIIVTLIFNIILVRIAQTIPQIIGGSDGVLLEIPAINLGLIELSLFSTTARYYLTVVITVACLGFLYYVMEHSPLGLIAKGIRANEDRMQAIGYNTDRLKIFIFAFSGIFAGLAGVLSSIQSAYISASNFALILSFDALTYVLLGGTGSLYGALLGVIGFFGLEYFVSPIFEFYLIIPAFLLMVVVLFVPGGLYGALHALYERVTADDDTASP